MKKKMISCLLVATMAVGLFSLPVQAAVMMIGDVDYNYEVDLRDAISILKAALGIAEQNQTMDVNRDDKVDLKDANKILRVALGIDTMADALVPNMDYIVEKEVSIELETDKESYATGECIKLEVRVQNNSEVSIPVAGRINCFEEKGSVQTYLVNESGACISKDENALVVNGGVLMSDLPRGESLVVERTIKVPEKLDVTMDEEEHYYIMVIFYYETNSHRIIKKFPVELVKSL